MAILSDAQKAQFHDDGFLLVEDVVNGEQLTGLQRQFMAWIDESKSHTTAWGATVDGRPRFDVEKGHSAKKPALRRVNSPVEVSQAYDDAMMNSRMPDIVAELIGPNIKYHHSKINSKLPGAATEVKWHQDFPFTPHSNDDLVTALLFVDAVTPDNGPLEIVPATHKGAIHGLWHDGKFTAAVADDVAGKAQGQAIKCTGPAGACCFMHTRLLHGSGANLSDKPRTLFITVYSAEDAIPLSPNPVPSSLEGRLVRGTLTGRVRSIPFEIELPQLPGTASFFDQQTTG
jgi:ectoine hydroxylase-related dioxygenase (phytanoyl-CoA dioxygenase family)